MSRRDVLKPFEENKAYMDDVINAGIERNRKGDVEITVKGSDGQPLKDIEIKVKQKTHEFKYGANIFMLDELESPEKNELYKKYFAEAFNMATIPFYWGDLEPEKGKPRYDKNSFKIYRRPPADLCLEFCEKNGIEPREHALAYEHFFPDWLSQADVNECKKEYERRCREIAERYKDKINTIEVTNEMWWNEGKTALYKSDDFIEFCFNTARKYFPDNQLVSNEWPCVWDEIGETTDKYFSYILDAINKGAMIDAIGFQYHMFFKADEEIQKTARYYNPKHLYKIMDLYSQFNMPLQLTEITIPAYSNSEEDEAIQAEILKNLYSIWFSHEKVEQIIYWNLIDGYAAFANQGDMSAGENYYYGGLIRFDLTPKPAYYMVKDLFQKVWHTEEVVCSNEEGTASFRGFYGKYDVEITLNGKTIKKEIDFSKKSNGKFDIAI